MKNISSKLIDTPTRVFFYQSSPTKMNKQITMPIKKRPLKAEISFLLQDQPQTPVNIARSNPPSRNGTSNGSNPSYADFTPTSRATGPHPSSSNAPQQIPSNDYSHQSSQGLVDGLTPASLTVSRRQAPGGNIILNEIHPNCPLQRSGATTKSRAEMFGHRAPTPPGSSAQHRALSNHAPPALPTPPTPPNPTNILSQRPSHAIAGTLLSQGTNRRKRSFHSERDTSEIQPNRQKRRLAPRYNQTTPSLQPPARLQTPFSLDEVQRNPARAHIPSQPSEQATISPSGATTPQVIPPPRIQEVSNDVHCDVCNAPFFNVEAVERHKTSQHPKENGRENTGWECPICRIVLKSRQNLRRHERVHGEDATLPCSKCHVLFTTERSRTSHMRDFHALPTSTRGPSKKSYTCAECSYASIQKTNVKRHINTVHRKLKRYHCPFEGCSYRASTRANLEAHKMSNMHSPANAEDEEQSDGATEEMSVTTEEGNALQRTRKDDDKGGEGGAGSAVPHASLPVL